MLPVDQLRKAEMCTHIWETLQKLETFVSIEHEFGKRLVHPKRLCVVLIWYIPIGAAMLEVISPEIRAKNSIAQVKDVSVDVFKP